MKRTIAQYKEIAANRMKLCDPSNAIDDLLTLAALCEELRDALTKSREYIKGVDGVMVFTSPENRLTYGDLTMVDSAIAKANEVLK
jgi:hypothetical protein